MARWKRKIRNPFGGKIMPYQEVIALTKKIEAVEEQQFEAYDKVVDSQLEEIYKDDKEGN